MDGKFGESVTPQKPCPVCGKGDWCQRAPSGFVHCMRSTQPPFGWVVVKHSDRGGVIFRQESDRDRTRRTVATKPGERPDAPKYHTKMAEDLAKAMTSAQLQEISAELGVDPSAIEALQIGWWNEHDAWSMPERDDVGRVVGINRRSPKTGEKKVVKGHKRGIYIPVGLANMPDPVLIVEGGSDVAACITMGLAAVGRHNNFGGIDYIARLLAGRQVIVVGENDSKPDGQWPGRDGASRTAEKLAGLWNATVPWSMCPREAKDARAWLNLKAPIGTSDQAARHAVGRDLLDELQKWVTEIDPSPGISTSGERLLLTNISESGKGAGSLRYITIEEIHDALAGYTDRWPRRQAGELFCLNAPTRPGQLPTAEQIWRLKNSDALFAWIGTKCEIRWLTKECAGPQGNGARTPVRRRELYEHMVANVQPSYKSIECMPHHPQLAGSYYIPCELPESDGTALEEFAERLNAETDTDRRLMIAAAITPGWGGFAGKRPAFVFMSDHGRGVGKSTTAQLIADLWGGAMMVAEDEDWEKVRKRFVNNSQAQRLVLIDNIKKRLSRGGLESAMTSPTIDGDKHYVGQSAIPNYFTWLLTANTPNLSRDLADRAVVIRIGKERHASDYESWRQTFISERRPQFIADCIAMLMTDPACKIAAENRDRWSLWQDGVLARMGEGNELAAFIKAGRPAVDSDLADADEVAEAIADYIRSAGKDPDAGRYVIPKVRVHDVLQAAGVGRRNAIARQTTAWIKALNRAGGLARMSEDEVRAGDVRSWLWVGTSPASANMPRETVDHPPQARRTGGSSSGPRRHDETDDGLPI